MEVRDAVRNEFGAALLGGVNIAVDVAVGAAVQDVVWGAVGAIGAAVWTAVREQT